MSYQKVGVATAPLTMETCIFICLLPLTLMTREAGCGFILKQLSLATHVDLLTFLVLLCVTDGVSVSTPSPGSM